MKRPLVSVVIPAYNASATLGRAIDSVLAQTFDDWELIVVDDGSADDTAEVARKRSDRAGILTLSHVGPGIARNRGAAESRGKYLAWLDADDVWYPTRLSRQVSLAESDSQVEFITGNYRFIDETGRSLGTGFDRIGWLMERVRTSARDGRIVLTRDDVPSFLRLGFGANITILLTRALFDRIGGYCDWLTVAEDMHFAMRAVAGSTKFAAICEPIATYYLRSDSTTRQDSENAQRETVRAYKDLRRMLSTGDRSVRSALSDSLSRAHLDHATVLARMGRRREGMAAAWKAMRLRPRRMVLSTMLGVAMGG